MLQLSRLFPQLTPGPGTLEQCEESFSLKETTATPKKLHQESNLEPFKYQASALSTASHTHTLFK